MEGLQRDGLALYELIKNEIQEISGSSDNDRLESASDMTATEASIIDAANKVATGAKATTMLQFQNSVLRCIHYIVRYAFREEQVSQVIGPDGAKVWVAWTGPGYFGDFDLAIDATSAKSNDPEVQKGEALQVVEMMLKTGGNVQLAVSEWLKIMGRKNPERYAPQLPQMPSGPPGQPGQAGPQG